MAASIDAPVHGDCAPGFERVRDAFSANFVEHGEVGAACHVFIDGEPVVDLWGGWTDRDRTRQWNADTLVDAYSVGKAFVGLLLLQLVDRGEVELDSPVADVWPEFAAGGKEAATMRQALCHQAGVPAIREPLTNEDLWDFDRMCAALAATRAWWVPGERHTYHTNTYGHLIGGIVRAITGSTPGELLAEVAAPLEADVHFGVPEADLGRCAEVIWGFPPHPPLDPWDSNLDDEQRMTLLSYANPPGYSSLGPASAAESGRPASAAESGRPASAAESGRPASAAESGRLVNSAEWRRAQIPSTNGHMTARGVARMYRGLLADGLLSSEVLAEATSPQSTGWCPILAQDVTFGLGFQPWTPERPLGRTPGGYGHFGTGGSLGFADPTRRIAFGYVMNQVVPRWQSPRNRALVDAVYASLDPTP